MNTEVPCGLAHGIPLPIRVASALSLPISVSLETLPIGCLVVNTEGTILLANGAGAACFGYQPEELLHQPVENLIPPLLRERHRSLRNGYIQQPVLRGTPSRELKALHRDGHEVSVAVGLSPMRMGEELHCLCTVVDLTLLKQAERDLERFFDLCPDLFCIANLQGYFLRVNRNFSRVLGYPDSQLLSHPFLEFVYEEDLEATRAEVARLAQGLPVVQFRNRYRHRDGGYLWLEWTSGPALEDGTIFAVARDISQRIHLETELRQQQVREQTILDSTAAVVYIKGIDGRYQFINQQFCDLFNVTLEQIRGLTDLEIFPPEIAAEFMANDQRVLASRQRQTLREVAPHSDGPHQYVSVKMPLLDTCGEPIALAGISTDITEQIRAQEARQQMTLARVFQEKLYPLRAPEVRGLEVAGAAVPVSQVCGDYYDYIRRGDRSLVVSVGDVSGHGFGPALQMVEVRTALRIYLRETGNLSRAVTELNQMLAEDLPSGNFVTLFLVEIDLEKGELRYIGAGHLALLFQASGEVVRLWSTGPLLGVDAEADYSEVGVHPFAEGDLLLLFTDGLTEATSVTGDEFGPQRVQQTVAEMRGDSSQTVVQQLFASVYEFARGKAIQDDITAISVKRVA